MSVIIISHDLLTFIYSFKKFIKKLLHAFLVSVFNMKMYKIWNLTFTRLRAREIYLVEGSTNKMCVCMCNAIIIRN